MEYILNLFHRKLFQLSLLLTITQIFPGYPTVWAEDKPTSKIILLIGDGMGPGQLGLLKSAWDYGRTRGLVPDRQSSYDQLVSEGDVSLISVKPSAYLVADSACAASSLSTGEECLPETLGLNEKGDAVEIFSEFAKKNQIAVGLVSDTRITHATPAAFYGRSKSRNEERLLAEQLVISGVDLAFSGGINTFDSLNDNLLDRLKNLNYNVSLSKSDFNSNSRLPTIGLFSSASMPDAFLELQNPNIPTLKEMSMKALELLSKRESYFLMIEAGQIDWAAHDNDAGLMLREMLRFEGVLHELLNYLKSHSDVTLMVISDHETGGFAFSYKRFNKKMLPLSTGFRDYKPRFNFLPESQLQHLFSQKISFQKASERMRSLHYNLAKTKIFLETEFNLSIKSDFENALKMLSTRNFEKIYKREFPNSDLYYLDENSLDQIVLSKYISRSQDVTWSTGSHTVPLIPFIIAGNKRESELHKPLTLSDVGKLIRSFY